MPLPTTQVHRLEGGALIRAKTEAPNTIVWMKSNLAVMFSLELDHPADFSLSFFLGVGKRGNASCTVTPMALYVGLRLWPASGPICPSDIMPSQPTH